VAAVACRAADEPEAQHVDGRMVARDGKAEFTFGKWRLYVEGVPTNSAGSRVAFQYPTKSGSGTSGTSSSSFDGVKVWQKWDEKANEITVEGFNFKLLGKADKLAFKATATPRRTRCRPSSSTRTARRAWQTRTSAARSVQTLQHAEPGVAPDPGGA
jgi:hypothetical protein